MGKNKSPKKRSPKKKKKAPLPTNDLEGIFAANSRGFGFVKIDDERFKQDVFIARRKTLGAMTGDRVSVTLLREKKGKRKNPKALASGLGPRGEVSRILERKQDFIVGVYHWDDEFGEAYVNPRVNGCPRIEILNEEDFGDRLTSGQMVTLKIKRFPTPNRQYPLGEIKGILGESGDPKAEEKALLIKYDLPDAFPQAVLDDAKKYRTVDPVEVEKRQDLRQKLFFTIDGRDSRDFDDAVAIESAPNGSFKLLVAIADVSHYVKPKTPLDQEAYRRATSVYFPTRAIHMLPENLSAGLCSLVPDQDRLALVAEMVIDREGKRRSCRIFEAVFKSHARLTYEEVEAVLTEGHFRPDEPKVVPLKDPGIKVDIEKSLTMMRKLQSLLFHQRQERGSLDFDIPEAQFIFDGDEESLTPDNIIRGVRLKSHRLIEEFMVTANEAVAEKLTEVEFPVPYRIHDKPDPLKIQNFLKVIQKIPETHDLIGKSKKKGSGDFWKDPRQLNRVLRKLAGHEQSRFINYLLLTSLQLAVYSPENRGHFGLGSKCYAHFTSPIRRYPDLLLHRSVKHFLKKQDSPFQNGQLAAHCDYCSGQERKAEEAERDMVKYYKVLFMREHLGEKHSGNIVTVTPFGFFVELDDFFVEGFVPIENLPEEGYVIDPEKGVLKGPKHVFQTGDQISVDIVQADLESRRITFSLHQ